MTIARDKETGAAVGQLLDRQPGIRDELGRVVTAVPQVLLLARDGRYVTVPAHSVRLEEI